MIFDRAIRTRREDARRRTEWPQPGFLLSREYAFVDKQVLSKIRNLFGGNLRLAVSGAAPINPEILRFFDAAGVLVLEGWGMTETSTAATISSPDDFKVGTIGKPFPGCEVRIAEDGEILVKGPNVFQGYHKNEEATRETIVDGWLHTGDIGEIDSEGFIKITGRKKDIIITAGGKNITPANLEAEIKQHPLVSQCVVVGDRRPYLVALVTLDPEEAVAYAKEHGLPEDPAQLAANAEIKASIEAHVEKINQNFARVEQVKKITILPHDLSQESGELTPTLKVKRAVVAAKHEGEIEALYAVAVRGGLRPDWRSKDRGRLLQYPPPGRGLLWLVLGGPFDHAADAALGDFQAVALGYLLEALVVFGEGGGYRFEAVTGDFQAPRVVHDRRAEHQLIGGLGLDQDDVDAGVLLLPHLDRLVQALVGDQPKGLVGDRRQAHVRDPPHPGAEDGRDRLLEVVDVGNQRVDDDDELGALFDRDVDVGGRADAAVDQLATLQIDRLIDDRQRGRALDRLGDRHVPPALLAEDDPLAGVEVGRGQVQLAVEQAEVVGAAAVGKHACDVVVESRARVEAGGSASARPTPMSIAESSPSRASERTSSRLRSGSAAAFWMKPR